MKKLILLLILCSFGYTQAQIVNIPDANFKAKLLEASPSNEIAKNLSGDFFKIDANDDGEIQVSEALQTSYLHIDARSLGIVSELTGIEAFVNLELLNYFSSLEPGFHLDLSQNTNLRELYFESEELNSIDVSQNINLESMTVYRGQLTTLDVSQNVNLIYLACWETQLTNVDLPVNGVLTNLDIGDNQLTNLDTSQNIYLEYINAINNNLTNLDLSQNINLELASFYYNDLHTVFAKNGVLTASLGLHNNPNLTYLCVDEFNLWMYSGFGPSVVVSSYCDFEPGGDYNTISGNVTFDTDNDGCDASDLPAHNVQVFINDGSEQGSTFVNSSGHYYFYTQAGNFALTASIENPTWFNISPVSVTIPFADNENNTTIQDFCVTAVGEHNDVEIVMSPLVTPRPGFDATYQIVYKNKGNQTLSGTLDFNFDDSVLDYIASSVPVDEQAEGILTWNYSDLVPLETRSIDIVLNVNGPTETPPLNIGDTLDFVATINPITDDETPQDNVFNLTQMVVGSYDPNDKTCLEGESLEPEMIGEYLHYNINFENTGTAAATFVVVKDVIDESMFDMNTLQVMFASHEMVTNITGNKVEFIFDNINLEPEGKGNVLFKIKTLNSLAIDDSVTNSAEIFFDYNFPIETNTTTTTFETLSVDEFEWSNAISMFPNPVRDVLEIKAEALMELISVYDVQGRKVFSKTINASNTSINVSNFTSGIYFLNIQTNRGEQVEKIIKN